MRKILKVTFIFAVALVSAIACTEALDYERTEKDTEGNGITIKEAAELFQQRIIDYEILKDDGRHTDNLLIPENYTPQWDNAEFTENEHIWSIETPILSDRKVFTFHKKEAKPWYAVVTQKLVIIKHKETEKMNMYILTLIPDKLCCQKHKRHREKTYTHLGNTSEFSGTAVYTLWDGTDILVNEHTEKKLRKAYSYDTEITNTERVAKTKNILKEFDLVPIKTMSNMSYEDGNGIYYCITCGRSLPEGSYICSWCEMGSGYIDDLIVTPGGGSGDGGGGSGGGTPPIYYCPVCH
ncbi:MAG: hypothetical protein LBT27_08875, partial [Prevotellaceae bacterium]|nr:hypothetical protein [Prevotellaceae bacterium]